MWSKNFEKSLKWAIILLKKKLSKLILHWFYTGVWFSIAFCVPTLSLAQQTLKKLGQNYFENMVSEY